jgi:archaellum component FlaF (FlaF/FlaG flagellin family)
MDNDTQNKGFFMGITTIAVIFVVVCITIFAVLSLSTAMQEERLSEKYADSVSAYWKTDNECTEVTNEFYELWSSNADITEYDLLCTELGADLESTSDGITISFNKSIDESNALAITLSIGDEFTVTKWQQEYSASWEADTSMGVWQGP